MRILIVTLYTENIRPYADLSVVNKRAYAKVHGYEFQDVIGTLDDSRPPAWSKILLLQETLPSYDWVFWSDSDSLIMNHALRLSDLINDAGDCDMILSSDVVSWVNTGQWLVRNTSWSAEILKAVWDDPDRSESWRQPWEQGSFKRLIDRQPAIKNRIRILPPRAMNSTDIAYFSETKVGRQSFHEPIYKAKHLESQYRRGDFIIHFMFSKNFEDRIRGMQHYFDQWRNGSG